MGLDQTSEVSEGDFDWKRGCECPRFALQQGISKTSEVFQDALLGYVVLAVGVDIIEISRIQAVLERHGDRFLRRVYTEGELAYADGRLSALAVRWAAKEAAAKALGTGIGDVSFQEIEVVCNPRGKPDLVLHGEAAQLAARVGLRKFALSLSHAADYAVAFVVAQGAEIGTQ